ncbi:MAG: ATP-binding protein [Bacteroidota bacterium]
MNQGVSTLMVDLERVIKRNITHYFNGQTVEITAEDFRLELLEDGPLLQFIKEHRLSKEAIVVLLLALSPHVFPDFLDHMFQRHLPQDGEYPQFGGVRTKNFRGLIPTGQTALILLAGNDLERQFLVKQLFSQSHVFAKKRILSLGDVEIGEPQLCGRLVLANDYIDLFTSGEFIAPRFSMRFPAQLLQTEMEWKDLVLNDKTRGQINELKYYLKYGSVLLRDWEIKKRLKPGYRVLFYGPPGTGKTLTATLLGKFAERPVYRVDLSMVVSKFIGETEKNLANLFARAENKDWILFFDEADALFGKRTNVRDAHDKYANQEVAYLLQRIEGYNGLVILASNFKSNIDEAFMRRFQSVIHFPAPTPKERLLLWEKCLPGELPVGEGVDLSFIAKKYDLTGSNIINVVQYCCLEALGSGKQKIENDDILQGIRKEYFKVGRIMG